MMRKPLAAALLFAAIGVLPACSRNDTADTGATNEATLTNDDFSSAQENLADGSDQDNLAAPDNAADADPVGNTGNTL